jgi:hypothetical protein
VDEVLPDVLGKEAEHQVAVFLKQNILAAISPVGVDAAQMLAAVQFDGDV